MLRVTCPPANIAQRRYIIETILGRWLGHEHTVVESAEATDTVIELTGSEGRLRVADVVLGLDDFERLDGLECGDGQVDPGVVASVLGSGPNSEAEPEPVPVLWGPVPSAATRESADPQELHVDIDVFGTAFALLTGLSELSITERDAHGRVPMAATIIGRRNLVSRPVVDEQVAILAAAMTRLWPTLEHRKPSPRSTPTHDIDRLCRYGTTAASAPVAVLGRLRSGDVAAVWAAARGAFDVHVRGATDPYFSFDRIMDLSEECGATSNFYFIPRYQGNDGTPPSRYSMRSPIVNRLLGRIDERGHTIGIHPGYDSFRNTGSLRSDLAELRTAAEEAGVNLGPVGGRHHYLRWDPKRSPGCWHEAGLAHDSSFGFSEEPGFRAGTSRPYPLWDHEQDQVTDVEERPLIWMDASIFATDPAGLESEAVLAEALQLRDRCHRHGGSFTFLVHNDGFAAPGGPEAYRLLLRS